MASACACGVPLGRLAFYYPRRHVFESLSQKHLERIAHAKSVDFPIPAETMDALRKNGYDVTSMKDDYGRVHAIMIDPLTNFRLGGADPREAEYAVGW